ncbi:hypothetical protein EBT16_03445 [bacterium]|nr:hypothetical protein [bacterium]
MKKEKVPSPNKKSLVPDSARSFLFLKRAPSLLGESLLFFGFGPNPNHFYLPFFSEVTLIIPFFFQSFCPRLTRLRSVQDNIVLFFIKNSTGRKLQISLPPAHWIFS